MSTTQTTSLVNRTQKETKPLQEFFRKFGNDWGTMLSGALAYSLLTALLPITIAIVAITGFILSNLLQNPNASQQIFSAIGSIPGLGSVKDSLSQSVGQRLSSSAGILAIIAVVIAIVGGSRLFVAMENSMDIIYRLRPRKFLAQNGMAIGMMIIFSILTPIMLFASTLPSTLLNLVSSTPALKQISFLHAFLENSITLILAGYAGALLASFLLFEAIYLIVPNQHISFRHSWAGAIVASILLQIFVILFPLYANNLLKNYVGLIGLAVVIVAFLYYFAIILILGAEVNAYFFEKVKPLPNNLATFVGTMAGNLNEDRPEAEGPHIDSHPTEHKDKQHIEKAVQDNPEIDTAAQGNTRRRDQQTIEQKQEHSQQSQPSQPSNPRSYTQPKQPGRFTTAISVVAGSTLAMGIELLRLRGHGK